MPWNESNHMDERLRFVARILEGEKMAVACREFGISRKTGYKIFNRYREAGIKGLEDKARSPYRHPNKTPFQIEKSILGLRRSTVPGALPRSERSWSSCFL
jgi:transposase